MSSTYQKKEYYSISEVCEITGLRPHVLRYWESQFGILRPQKNRAGNRNYRKREIDIIFMIKHLLYEKRYTIEGARQEMKKLKQHFSPQRELPLEDIQKEEMLTSIRNDLRKLLELIEQD
ncbi:MAG: MerR family transcriptional regulator [Candidatus Glassbacteria bacterium]